MLTTAEKMEGPRLAEVLHKRSWEGRHWGPDGTIATSRLLFKLNQKTQGDHALSGLSSSYYTAAGHAKARAYCPETGQLEKWFWLARAYYCGWRSLRLSDKLEQKVGRKNMSPNELNIRSAILRRAEKYDESIKCCDQALGHSDNTAESRVLLFIGRAEANDAVGNRVKANNDFILARVLITSSTSPGTVVRFYRARARHLRQSSSVVDQGKGYEDLRKANGIAGTFHLKDQECKIKAEMNVYYP